MILNITPDHLDRYQYKFENYVASKMRIFENQTADQIHIFNHDDDVVSNGVSAINQATGPKTWAFSALSLPEEGIGVKDGTIYFNLEHQQEALMEVGELSLKGTHNLRNGLAAALAARAGEIENDYIRESLATFKGVAHRLEFVRELDEVRYINDSKATNVNSVWYALESFEDPIVLILGGVDKGNDYSELASLIRRKVRAVIALGEGKAKIEEQLGGIAHDFSSVSSMEEAIETARKKAQPHDVVLLSPACASFDMFDNYEHRGEIFKELVKQLR
jgi:UDP-N-acetylmuramoylalanine--D-glutamate ligase